METVNIEGKRHYITPKGTFPSVTTILSTTAENSYLEVWRNKVGHENAEAITKRAADRGTIVHQFLEDYLLNKYTIDVLKHKIRLLPIGHQKVINDIIHAVDKHKFQPLHIEAALYNSTLQYAGRTDAIGLWDGKLAVVDFKNSRKSKPIKWIQDYLLQCCAYALAAKETFGLDIKYSAIIIGFDEEKGDAQIVEGNPLVHQGELIRRINLYYSNKEQNDSN